MGAERSRKRRSSCFFLDRSGEEVGRLEDIGCSVASTWLSCDSRLEDAYTWGWGDREVRKQLDYVITPRCSKLEAQMHHGERVRAWDHYLVSVALDKVRVRRGKKAGAEWKLKDDAEIMQFRRALAPKESLRDGVGLAEGVLAVFKDRLKKRRGRQRRPQ